MNSSAPPVVITGTQTHRVTSTATGEEFELGVALPDGYAESSDRYPVLYVLDAPFFFAPAWITALTLFYDGQLPQVIVVGLGRPVSTLGEWLELRNVDLATRPEPGQDGSGRAESFLEVLATELMPWVDERFRTDVADRTLWGQSLGADFVLWTLGRRPGLCRRWLATSPEPEAVGAPLTDPAHPVHVGHPTTVALVTGADDAEIAAGADAYARQVAAVDHDGLRLRATTLPGCGHTTTAVSGLMTGLRSLWS